jgi:hypothetical protein
MKPQAPLGAAGINVEGLILDPVVKETLASVAVAPRVAAACCLHQLAQFVQVTACLPVALQHDTSAMFQVHNGLLTIACC